MKIGTLVLHGWDSAVGVVIDKFKEYDEEYYSIHWINHNSTTLHLYDEFNFRKEGNIIILDEEYLI